MGRQAHHEPSWGFFASVRPEPVEGPPPPSPSPIEGGGNYWGNFKYFWLDFYTIKSENLSLPFSDRSLRNLPSLWWEGMKGEGINRENSKYFWLDFLSKCARIPPSSAGGMNGLPSPL